MPRYAFQFIKIQINKAIINYYNNLNLCQYFHTLVRQILLEVGSIIMWFKRNC